MTEVTGSTVAGYRIESVIGRGGMATVYKAEDSRLGRKVALKLLSPALAGSEQFQQRFIRESRLAASLDHPNIIPIYEAGDSDGVLFIAMRYVAGSDLKVLLGREGRLDPDRAVRLFTQIGDALDAAHGLGLVHRDVKPGNILVTQVHEHADELPSEHVYLTDFGLTKRTSSLSGGLTGTGHFLGTVDYVAPEQIQGKPVGPEADMYALGCLLYEALTGRVPFHRDDDAAVLWAHLVEMPLPVTALRPDLPAAVNAVVSRAMAKQPEDRFASCHDMMRALRHALGQQAPGVPAAGVQPEPVVAGVAGEPGSDPGVEGAFDAAGTGVAAMEPGQAAAPQPDQAAFAADPESLVAGHADLEGAPVAVGPGQGVQGGPEQPDWPEAGYEPEGEWAAAEQDQAAGPEAWTGEAEGGWTGEAEGEWPGEAEGEAEAAPWAEELTAPPGRGRRRWLVPAIAAAVVIVLGAVAAFVLLPSRGETLSKHFSSTNSPVQYTLDHPGSWTAQQGVSTDAVVGARPDLVGSLFFERGTGNSWAGTQRLLGSSPGDAVGVYVYTSFTTLDTSSLSALQQSVSDLLPAVVSFTPTDRRLTVAGAPTDELEAEVHAPSSPSTRLGLVVDVVQSQQGGLVLMVFFAPPDQLDSQRALFEKVRNSLRITG